MTRAELCAAINTLASEYLGHSVEVTSSNWPKKRLEFLHQRYVTMIGFHREANQIRDKYTTDHWLVLNLFPQNDQEEQDLVAWAEKSRAASDIWISPGKPACPGSYSH